MFNFDVPRYEKVVGDAIALRPQIEKAVDEICKEGYSNIFFIGCGGTYAHSLPMKYWFDTTSEIETHSVIAAEFMVSGHKRFTKDSVCVFSTRSGNTKEIVAAIKYCKEAGARTLVYVSNDITPACEYADYKFFSFAEDDCLCEAIYTYMITLLARFKKKAGEFDKYDECRFGSRCIHENEPSCAVKEAVENGDISKKRYESYIQLLNEIRSGKRRY